MAATTTLSISSLIELVAPDLPDVAFHRGNTCKWHPASQTITYTDASTRDELLHEIGHALLQHDTYTRDIILLEMERDAWRQAQTIGRQHGVTITNDTVQDHLDTYRDWLHARSTCPTCTSTGIQTDTRHYRCYECACTWQVNEARQCALRRYTKKPLL